MFQYIHDTNGNTTAIIIPIDTWEKIKSKHQDIEEIESEEKIPMNVQNYVLEIFEKTRNNSSNLLTHQQVLEFLESDNEK